MDEHLTFPIQDEPEVPIVSAGPSQPTKSNPILSERLYVGNLHSTIDEASLLKIFSKFGKVSRLDYLFHKAGPMKGKPRGFAFVEFSDAQEAKKAVDTLHDRVARGRKLIVSFATQSGHQPNSYDSYSSSSGGGPQRRRYHDDVNRPTPLSLLKTPPPSRSGSSSGARRDGNNGNGGGGGGGGGRSTENKIAALEAKLKQMKQPPAERPPGFDKLPQKPLPPSSRS